MKRIRFKTSFYDSTGVGQYLIVISVVAVTVMFFKLFESQKGYYIVSFILLFEVSVMAVFLKIGPILVASTISALAWNYFFIPPHFAFHIERTEDQLMFGSFFLIALINGVLTNRIKRQELLALRREERTNAIFQVTRELSNSGSVKEILTVAHHNLEKYFRSHFFCIAGSKGNYAELLVPEGIIKAFPGINKEIAGWVSENSMKAGRHTNNFPGEKLTYYPLPGQKITTGVIVTEFEEPMSEEEELFWTAYITQVSNALERELLNELAHQARLLTESEKLYKTLFTSISHEFRIPIATIMGSSDTLLNANTTDGNKTVLLDEIFKASARLNHLVENLLNMSRLESGKLSVHQDWCDINDILNEVRRVLSLELEEHTLVSVVPADIPLVRLDFGLIEQVIYNLILNSCQYTHTGSVIKFEALYKNGSLNMVVEDDGPGFTPEQNILLFSKFFRGESNRSGGLGLGLSIVKGIVEAHNGTVTAENMEKGGARFYISIPSDLPDLKTIIE